MRKVVYSMMVSLDGFISGPQGELDWHVIDEELHQWMNDQAREYEAFLFGRRMYDTMDGYWSTADTNPESTEVELDFARIYQRIPKIVFSTTLQKVGKNAQLIRGDIANEVKKLKEQPGKDMGLGGAGIAATFLKLGLIDEYHLYVNPVIVGVGRPAFPHEKTLTKLKLISTRTFGSGVVMLRYQNG